MKKLLLFLLIGVACIILILLFLPYLDDGGCVLRALPLPKKGESLTRCIIISNTEFEERGEHDIWPESERFSEMDKEYSEAYFVNVVSPMYVDNIPRFQMFCGAGIPCASNADDFLEGGKNAWSYIGGGTPDNPMPTNAPFLFTKNLRLANNDLHYYSKPENAKDKSFFSKFDASEKPFGSTPIIVIYRDASVKTMKAKDLTPSAFFNGCKMPPNAYVVHPR